jgi:predicted nuclease of predicted toxin-antitoxin system
MTFLANENFPFPSIQLLQQNNFIVKSISKIRAGMRDKEVIELAQKEKAVILTFDRDYGELIARHALQNPPAVVYFRLKGSSPEYAAEILMKLMKQNIIFENHFTVIESGNIRQRKY